MKFKNAVTPKADDPPSADDPLLFVLSDGSKDRMGDTIQPSGWDLSAFKTNPIALWAHDSKSPIGTWSDVRVVGKQLVGKLSLAAQDTSAWINVLRSMVEQQILRAVSVGFTPIEVEPLRDAQGRPTRGFNFIKQELLEVSLVSVGANLNALAVARSMNLSDAEMSELFTSLPAASLNPHRKTPGASAVKAREAIARAQAVLGLRK